MIKYKANEYGPRVEEVDVIRETDKCVFRIGWHGREQRESKSSSDCSYFDTFADAKECLVANAKHRMDLAQFKLDRAMRHVVAAESLQEAVAKEG